jgi:hypothetical protein
MLIRWSAQSWRPKINFGAVNAVERPEAIRIVKPGQVRLQCFEEGSGI